MRHTHILLTTLWLAPLSALVAGEPGWKGPKDTTIPNGIRVERDVAYLGPSRKEKADVYLPEPQGQGRRVPAVLLMHGGGFNDGDKARAREVQMAVELAKHGFVCMSVNYQLWSRGATKPTWPQSLYDAKAAVRWLRVNTVKLGLDPERIAAFGNSAGGNLALMLATTTPEDGLEPPAPYPEVSTRVACAVDFYGALDLPNYHDMKMFLKTRQEDPDVYRRASPLSYVKSTNAPMLIVHGTNDQTVPVSQARTMARALRRAGVPHQLELVPDAPHTFYLVSPARDFRELVFGFLDKHMPTR